MLRMFKIRFDVTGDAVNGGIFAVPVTRGLTGLSFVLRFDVLCFRTGSNNWSIYRSSNSGDCGWYRYIRAV